MHKNRIPRRASRNLWHRFKRWLRSFSPEEREWKRIIHQPHVRKALRRMAQETKERNID